MALAGRDARAVPRAWASEAAAHGLVLASASKAWNIAGLKAAVVVSGSEPGAALAERLPPHLPYHAGHFGVLASIAAFERRRARGSTRSSATST